MKTSRDILDVLFEYCNRTGEKINICNQCGEAFVSKKPLTLCIDCRNPKPEHKNVLIVCHTCGKTFEAKNHKYKYCSECKTRKSCKIIKQIYDIFETNITRRPHTNSRVIKLSKRKVNKCNPNVIKYLANIV